MDDDKRCTDLPEATDAKAADDAELESLFSAFDQVKASDELQEATLAAIFAAADEADGRAPQASAAPKADDRAANPPLIAFADAQAQHARRKRGKPVRSAAFRASRVAVAACLALAVGGGVAYATPSAQASIEEDDTVITLDVNVFGITIGQHGNGEEADALLSGLNLMNRGYEDCLDDVVEAFDQRAPEGAAAEVRVDVEGGFGPQRNRMQQAADQRMEARPAPTADASQPASQGEGPEPEGQGQMTGEAQPGAPADEGQAPAGGPGWDAGAQAPEGQPGDAQPDEGSAPSGQAPGNQPSEGERATS